MYQSPNLITITDSLYLMRQNSLLSNVLIADVYKNEFITPQGGRRDRYVGYLIAFFNEFPKLEDESIHWKIRFFDPGNFFSEKDARDIVHALISYNLISEPLIFSRIRLKPYDESEDFFLQIGKIYPDDE